MNSDRRGCLLRLVSFPPPLVRRAEANPAEKPAASIVSISEGIVLRGGHPHNARVQTAPSSLAGLTKPELAEKLVAVGVEPKKAKMRAEQLWRWIYHYGVTDFSAMTNVAKELRATLAKHYTLARPEIVTKQV